MHPHVQERLETGQEADTTLQESPTHSQMAKKKLGFEGLFDCTDPEVSGIDDVIGLCSGKFATQAAASQQPLSGQDSESLLSDISGFAPLAAAGQRNLETQDTVEELFNH